MRLSRVILHASISNVLFRCGQEWICPALCCPHSYSNRAPFSIRYQTTTTMQILFLRSVIPYFLGKPRSSFCRGRILHIWMRFQLRPRRKIMLHRLLLWFTLNTNIILKNTYILIVLLCGVAPAKCFCFIPASVPDPFFLFRFRTISIPDPDMFSSRIPHPTIKRDET
jgi:hypothetical protein